MYQQNEIKTITMTNSTNTQSMNTFQTALNSLKSDLSNCWITRNDTFTGVETDPCKMALNSVNFIYGLDPQNMGTLRFFFDRFAEGCDSLNTFASKIMKGEFQIN